MAVSTRGGGPVSWICTSISAITRLILIRFRNLNVLLYLNQSWKPDYKGELKLRHKVTGAACAMAPLFPLRHHAHAGLYAARL